MVSRLKLKKRKKFHPPIDDFEEQHDNDKTMQSHNVNSDRKIKTGTENVANSTNPTEPNQQPDIDDDDKLVRTRGKNNLNKSYAQMAGNLNKTDIEDRIFINAIASVKCRETYDETKSRQEGQRVW